MPNGKCSICGKEAVEKFNPFCSQRCANVDLGRWLGEGYRVPAEEDPDDAPSLPNHEKDEEIE